MPTASVLAEDRWVVNRCSDRIVAGAISHSPAPISSAPALSQHMSARFGSSVLLRSLSLRHHQREVPVFESIGSVMVRLNELHADERNKMLKAAPGLPRIDPGPWLSPPPLAAATVAIVTTSGIHRRQDPPFRPGLGEYRILPADVDMADLTMSHISVNFDRTAFQQDPNVWFPLDRLREMEADGEIGGVARWHYAFMGGIPTPMLMEQTGQEVGRFLRGDGVDVVILVPV